MSGQRYPARPVSARRRPCGRRQHRKCSFHRFCSNLSLGTTTRGIYVSLQTYAQFGPAFSLKRLQKKGFVTTPTVSIPISLAVLAMMGAKRLLFRLPIYLRLRKSYQAPSMMARYLIQSLLCGARSDLRLRLRAKPPGQLFAYLYLCLCQTSVQKLVSSVLTAIKLDALKACFPPCQRGSPHCIRQPPTPMTFMTAAFPFPQSLFCASYPSSCRRPDAILRNHRLQTQYGFRPLFSTY